MVLIYISVMTSDVAFKFIFIFFTILRQQFEVHVKIDGKYGDFP